MKTVKKDMKYKTRRELATVHLSCMGVSAGGVISRLAKKVGVVEGVNVSHVLRPEGVLFSCEVEKAGLSSISLQIFDREGGWKTLQRWGLAMGARVDYFYFCPPDERLVSYRIVSE